jgi:hypothetical protein
MFNAPAAPRWPAITAIATTLTFFDATTARADTVVQFPVDTLLNARPVSTLTNGVVVPWTATQGVDGNGGGDGYVTKAVEAKLGQMGAALPDDGVFPAANGIPEIDLHFSNSNTATSFQAHNAHHGVAASIDFAVPQATYSKVFLVLTSAEGADKLTVTMTYADATTSVTLPFTLADYDTALAANTAEVTYFSLISMHKWTPTDQQTDNAGHQITGVSLTPTPTKPLTSIKIAKPADGQYLVFWGATGIATSPVDAGVSGAGLDSGTEDGASDSSIGATNDDAASGMAGGSSGSGGTASSGVPSSGAVSSGGGSGSSGAASSGASSGATMSGSGTPSSGPGSSGTGTTPYGGGPNSGCSLSGPSRTYVPLWGSLLALCAIITRRRLVRAAEGRGRRAGCPVLTALSLSARARGGSGLASRRRAGETYA